MHRKAASGGSGKMKFIGLVAVVAVLVMAGLAASEAVKSLLMIMMIYSIFAMSYDVLLGYANQPSLGQSLFFGLGAYGMILPITRWEWSFWPSLAAGLILGLISAMLVGLVAVRLVEAYHVIFTAIIASVTHLMAKNMTPLTGGSGGLPTKIPPISLGPYTLSVYDPLSNYFLILGFSLAVFLVLSRLVESPLGKIWTAIRENETRVSFLSYNTYFYKLAAFALAGFMTSLAGVLYAVRMRYASAEFFAFEWSLLPFIWILVGGIGTLYGAILGVAVFTFFQYYVSEWWAHYLILFGLLIIFMLRWAPKGIIGIYRSWRQTWRA
ncbi:MAG: branched-chain amino acid ABC transporter permease [Desulfobacterales bacterium]|nr:MAG: branched-chain amino acid ABC transporter permease [Desulfobacterales bacterium]